MNILAIDLGAWFTSVSGILITCGVILLIIALVLFVVGGKKAKKDSKAVNSSVSGETNANVEQPNPTTDVNATANNVETVQPNVAATVSPELVINSNDVSAAEQVQTVATPETVSIDPTVGVAPASVQPEPVVSTTEINPVPTISNEESLEMPDATNLDKTMVSVYGGANPIDAIANVTVDEHKPIYGGNDPLEATQNLPKMDEHHEPYGGAMDEGKIAEAVNQTIPSVPEVQPIQMPELQPIEPVNTVVEEVKPIAVETPNVEPAVAPTPIEIPTPNAEATPVAPVEIPTPAAQPTTTAPEQVEEL